MTMPTAAELNAAVALLENHGDIVGNVSAAMIKRMKNAADALADAPVMHPASPLDTATEYLIDRGACPECSHPVHTTNGPDRGWIHTETDQYTCPPGTAGSTVGPAITDDVAETKYNEGYADGQQAQEDIDNETMHTDVELGEAVEAAENRGTGEGRTAMRRELEDALFAAMTDVGDDASADQLRQALVDAWNETPA